MFTYLLTRTMKRDCLLTNAAFPVHKKGRKVAVTSTSALYLVVVCPVSSLTHMAASAGHMCVVCVLVQMVSLHCIVFVHGSLTHSRLSLFRRYNAV